MGARFECGLNGSVAPAIFTKATAWVTLRSNVLAKKSMSLSSSSGASPGSFFDAMKAAARSQFFGFSAMEPMAPTSACFISALTVSSIPGGR